MRWRTVEGLDNDFDHKSKGNSIIDLIFKSKIDFDLNQFDLKIDGIFKATTFIFIINTSNHSVDLL